MKINLQLSYNFTCLQKIKTIAYVIIEILKICYFGTLWAYTGMPGRAHPKKAINLQPSRNLICMQKIKIFAQLVHEILKNYYFGTLWACLGMSSQRPTKIENFPKYGI